MPAESSSTPARADDLLDRILGLAIGGACLWLANVAYGARAPVVRPESVAAIFADTLAAIVAVGLSVVPDRFRPRSWQAFVALSLIAALIGTFAVRTAATPGYGADTLALAHLAAERTLAGANPYGAALDPLEVERRFNLPLAGLTQLEPTGHIASLVSYPALHHLIFVPALALHIEDLRWVVLAFEAAVILALWILLPGRSKLAAILPVVVNPDLFLNYAAGSLTDWLWVLPLVGTTCALYHKRVWVAALTFGIACAVKQSPWVATPFLLVWVLNLHVSPIARSMGRAGSFIGLASVTFLAFNLPYIVWNPSAWAAGVLLPVTQPLVADGSGFSLLSLAGLLPFSKTFYMVCAAAVGGLALVLLLLFYSTLRGAIWLFPALLLWLGYRSFANYVVFWLPLAALSVSFEHRFPIASVGARTALERWPRVVAEHRAAIGIAAATVVALVVGVVAISEFGHPALEMHVLDLDSQDLDRLMLIQMSVTNSSNRPVPQPGFSVGWRSTTRQWTADGPASVPPGQTAVFTIRPTSLDDAPTGRPSADGRMVFPDIAVRVLTPGAGYQVYVHEPSLPHPDALVNSRLVLWQQGGSFDTVAYGWRQVLTSAATAQPNIERTEAGVRLEVTKSAPAHDWGEAGLVQSVDFAGCEIVRLTTSHWFEFTTSDGVWPAAAAGVEVRPEGPLANGEINWFVLTEADPRTYELPSGLLVSAVHLGSGLETVDIPIGAVLRSAGRNLPSHGNVKVFAAAVEEPGIYRFDVRRVQCVAR